MSMFGGQVRKRREILPSNPYEGGRKQWDDAVLRFEASTRELHGPDKHPSTANVLEPTRRGWNPMPSVGSTSGIVIPCLVSKSTRIVDYDRVDFCNLECPMVRQTTKETSNEIRQAR
jgi:hypothetical protein